MANYPEPAYEHTMIYDPQTNIGRRRHEETKPHMRRSDIPVGEDDAKTLRHRQFTRDNIKDTVVMDLRTRTKTTLREGSGEIQAYQKGTEIPQKSEKELEEGKKSRVALIAPMIIEQIFQNYDYTHGSTRGFIELIREMLIGGEYSMSIDPGCFKFHSNFSILKKSSENSNDRDTFVKELEIEVARLIEERFAQDFGIEIEIDGKITNLWDIFTLKINMPSTVYFECWLENDKGVRPNLKDPKYRSNFPPNTYRNPRYKDWENTIDDQPEQE